MSRAGWVPRDHLTTPKPHANVCGVSGTPVNSVATTAMHTFPRAARTTGSGRSEPHPPGGLNGWYRWHCCSWRRRAEGRQAVDSGRNARHGVGLHRPRAVRRGRVRALREVVIAAGRAFEQWSPHLPGACFALTELFATAQTHSGTRPNMCLGRTAGRAGGDHAARRQAGQQQCGKPTRFRRNHGCIGHRRSRDRRLGLLPRYGPRRDP